MRVRDWRSCCVSKKCDKAESAEGRSPVRGGADNPSYMMIIFRIELHDIQSSVL
jgi:hypothetical protein